MLLKLSLTPRSRKGSPVIRVSLWLDQIGTGNRDRTKYHGSRVTSGTGTTRRPPHVRTKESCVASSALRFQGRIRT
jgi:hypothetical protein